MNDQSIRGSQNTTTMSSFVLIESELFEATHSKVQVDVPGAIYPSHSRKEPKKEVDFKIPRELYEFAWKKFSSQLVDSNVSGELKPNAADYKSSILLIHQHNAAILHGAWVYSISDSSSTGTLLYDYLEVVERTEDMQKIIDNQRGRLLSSKIGIL